MGFTWDGYTKVELQRIIYLHRTDPVGMIYIAGLLTWLLTLCGGFEPVNSTLIDEPGNPMGAIILAVFAAVPLIYSIYVFPINEYKLSPQDWAVQTYIGRWAYLTRWLLTMQFQYQVMSVFAEIFGGKTKVAVYSLVTPLGAFSFFVTTQYYSLVASNPKFLEICEMWEKRGEDVKFMGDIQHAPAAFIALADMFFVKDFVLLDHIRPDLHALMWIVICFAFIYLGSASINKYFTGHWPYPFMENIKTLGAFLRLAVVQSAILNIFMLSIWLMQIGYGKYVYGF